MLRSIRKFNDSKSGAVAIIIALAMVAMVGILMLTLNLTKQQNADSNTQGSSDSAALAAAQIITQKKLTGTLNLPNPLPAGGVELSSDDEIYQLAKQAFMGNAGGGISVFCEGAICPGPNHNFTVKIKPAAGGEKQVVVHGCHKVTNNQAIGANAKESVVCNNSTAMIGNLTGEIVFALDVSASMKNSCGASLCPNGSKIRELQLAATNVINKQLTNAGPAAKASGIIPGVYWGAVPFRGMVDLGGFANNVISTSGSKQGNSTNEQAYSVSGSSIGYGNSSFEANLKRVPITEKGADFANDSPKSLRSYVYQDKQYWYYWQNEAPCGYCKPRVQTGLEWLSKASATWTKCTEKYDCHTEKDCDKDGKNCKNVEKCKTRQIDCKCGGTGPGPAGPGPGGGGFSMGGGAG